MGLRRFIKKHLLLSFISERLNDINKKMGDMDSLLRDFDKRFAEADSLLENVDKRLAGVSYFNLLSSLAIPGSKIRFYLPGGTRECVDLYYAANGRLCFNPDNRGIHRKALYLNTLPKSGTHFYAAIFDHLGFVHSSFEIVQIHDPIIYKLDGSILMPGLSYEISATLVLPNQYLIGHVNAETILKFHSGNPFLLGIRDLRHATVSQGRYVAFLDGSECSYPDHLLKFMKTLHFDTLIYMANECTKMLKHPYVRLCRFEDLFSDDKSQIKSTLEALSSATGCGEEEILEAIKKCRGTITATYSGRRSELRGMWDDQVEEYFVSRGGDILNEKLGYPRKCEYT